MADFMWAALLIVGVSAIVVAVILGYDLWERRKHQARMRELKKNFDDEYWQ